MNLSILMVSYCISCVMYIVSLNESKIPVNEISEKESKEDEKLLHEILYLLDT